MNGVFTKYMETLIDWIIYFFLLCLFIIVNIINHPEENITPVLFLSEWLKIWGLKIDMINGQMIVRVS